jgi:hypothetical protein
MKRVKVPGKRMNEAPIFSAPSRAAEAFNNSTSEMGPTASNFVLDFDNSPKSRWNLKATQIFIQQFLRTYPGADRDAVERAFATHLVYLKKQYKQYANRTSRRGVQDIDEDEQGRIERARDSRRRGVRQASRSLQ